MFMVNKQQKKELTSQYDDIFMHYVAQEDIANLQNLLRLYTPPRILPTSPLHLAIARNNLELFNFLVELNVFDLNVQQLGQTVLHKMIEKNDPNLTQAITQFVSTHREALDIDIQNDYGQTALHIAAIKNNKEIYEFLLSQNANTTIVDKLGRNPIYYADKEPPVIGKYEYVLDGPLKSHPEQKVKMLCVQGKKPKKPKVEKKGK